MGRASYSHRMKAWKDHLLHPVAIHYIPVHSTVVTATHLEFNLFVFSGYFLPPALFFV